MTNSVESGSNGGKKWSNKWKQAALIGSLALALSWGMTSCDQKRTDIYGNKDARNSAELFLKDFKEFREDKMLNLVPELLYDDSVKTVIAATGNWGTYFSVSYKGENRKTVYYNALIPENITVFEEVDWVCTRKYENLSIPEAEAVYEEMSGYLEALNK